MPQWFHREGVVTRIRVLSWMPSGMGLPTYRLMNDSEKLGETLVDSLQFSIQVTPKQIEWIIGRLARAAGSLGQWLGELRG